MKKITQICLVMLLLPGFLWAGNESSMRADRLSRTGIYAYVADLDGSLRVIDVSDPANPTEVGFCGIYSPRDVCVSESYAYLADSQAGLRIMDISDPTNPYVAGTYNTDDYAIGVYASGSYAYVTDNDSLLIVDISDPANPTLVGSFDNGYHFASDVYVSGNYAYAGAQFNNLKGGILILDVSDPENPFELGFYELTQDWFWVEECVVSGSYAYLALWFPAKMRGNSGRGGDVFEIVDVSDPSNPFRVGVCELPSIAMGVSLAGNYAYVAGWEHGLRIIDISDPSNPFEVGFCNQSGDYLFGVNVLGNYAYAADFGGFFRTYDVSDPTNPFETGHIEGIWGAYAVNVVDNEPPQVSVISPNGGEGFEPGDICDITWLAEDIGGVGSISILYSIDAGMDWDTIATGEVNDSTYSWTVPDTQSDSCLVKILAYDSSLNVGEDQSDAFFSISTLGIEESNSSPGSLTILNIAPNPFRGSTEITFGMGQNEGGNRITSGSMFPGSCLKIYDVGGRLIRQWDYPDADQSCHVVWEGRDDHGCEVSPGVYLVRFETQDHAVTEKVILLK